MAIVIYRKSGNKVVKPTKAQLDRLDAELEVRVRVRRPSLEEMFIPAKASGVSEFYKMAELSPSLVKNRAARILDHADAGWEVPADSLGRSDTTDENSTAQSIRLWIAQNLSAVVDIQDVAVVVE